MYKECMIAEELLGVAFMRKSSCLRLKENDTYQWSLVVENFYRVGDFFDEFTKHFRPSDGRNPASDLVTNYFPQLAKTQPVFVSSAYGLPYPLAAIMEYNKIEQTVCQNEHKRLSYLRQIKNKDEFVKTLSELKKQGKITAMIGDGINDAPALAFADVGMVFSNEEQTAATDAADIVFLGGDFLVVFFAEVFFGSFFSVILISIFSEFINRFWIFI